MLKTVRKAKGMSQKSLGELLGKTQSYVSRLENKEKYNMKVTVDLIEQIAEKLEADIVDIFFYFCNNEYIPNEKLCTIKAYLNKIAANELLNLKIDEIIEMSKKLNISPYAIIKYILSLDSTKKKIDL
ncbi:helix-turn-helix domain-containing protein [Clostridium sp. Marseille-QA1073]